MVVREGLEIVLEVLKPIPALGAKPGDEIVVRPGQIDCPVVVRRIFSTPAIAQIPDAAVRMIYAAPDDERPSAPGVVHQPAPLRLVHEG